MPENVYDVIIIGGGPAGSTSALYTARAGLKTLVIDKSIRSGALGITSKIANYPAIPEVISGAELVERIWKQSESFGAEYKKIKVVRCELTGELKTIYASDATEFKARTVILATGAMGRSNLLPGEEKFLGRGVSYCATCDGAFFKGHDCVVIGYSEEACEEALYLTRFTKKLYIVTPKPRLEAPNELAQQLPTKQVEFLFETRPVEIIGKDHVEQLKVTHNRVERLLNISGVFIYTQGSKPIVDYLGSGLNIDPNSCILVDDEMRTNIPGVFACGDILCNNVQQAVVAAGQGCVAALSCDKYLRKRKGFIKDYK